MQPDLYVVGAGLFGLTVAERAASQWHKRVTVVERRSHVGGNAYSDFDGATGIEVHRYGAHIFHTNNERVWQYVNEFSSFVPYEHRVFTRYGGTTYPMPINLQTINQFFGRDLSPTEARAFIQSQASSPTSRREKSLREWAVSQIGEDLYTAFIEGYTAKQWATDPSNLPAGIIARLPVRFNFDSRYFEDSHQGMPRDGYTEWVRAMAEHPLIEVRLEQDVATWRSLERLRNADESVPVVYTGPIDRFFGYELGHLGWRTVDFEYLHSKVDDFQGAAVINEADQRVPWTRSIEFRHFRPDRKSRTVGTVVAREYSRFAEDADEPYYPINAPEDRSMLLRYRNAAARVRGTFFAGRLGSYKYLDMHMAIASALALIDKIAAANNWSMARRRETDDAAQAAREAMTTRHLDIYPSVPNLASCRDQNSENK